MSNYVCNGAVLKCSFGSSSSSLVVLPDKKVMTVNQFAANILDNKSMTNIMPFGLCTSLANPVVAAATSANQGVLTPMPCIPSISGPWAPGMPTVMLANQPALNNECKLNCNWAGTMEVVQPGQMTVQT